MTRNRIILLGIVAALIIMQFIGIDKTNPPVEASKEFMTLMTPPTEIATMLKASCYDCHSHETTYPWYSNVAPVNFWLKGHVRNGSKKLNYSTWGNYEPKKAAHKLEECAEVLEDKWMPLKSYTFMHPAGKLSEEDRATLIAWFKEQEAALRAKI